MRKQRAFASLTEQEIDQITDWLRHQTYAEVLKRISKPRPEGFGLTVSTKHLENLHARKNTLDQINRKIASGGKNLDLRS